MNEFNLSAEEFERDFRLKEDNWFYAGMAAIWLSFVTRVIGHSAQIGRALDAGCGAGGKMPYLKTLAKETFGLDLSIDALNFTKDMGYLKLTQAKVEKLPYKDGSYGLVSAFDVLEHVEDDMAALGELNRVLDDKGFLVITVPAFNALWSQHDIANFHKRRYRVRDLKEKLEKMGFEIKRSSYAGFFMFPAALVYRVVQYRILRPFFKVKRTRVENLPSFLNKILKSVLVFESHLIKMMNLPFGIALFCVAQKKSTPKGLSRYLGGILVCPKCGAPLNTDGAADAVSGHMVCGDCRNKYDISSGIPRFLDKDISSDKKRTARNFGYSWKAFPRYCDFYQEQFLDWIWPVKPQDLDGKVVLDAGCGSGRHVYQAARLGAKEVVGFDLSEAIDVAYKNTKEYKNIHLLQADIYNLPLSPVFDYIYSIGVLHHLPDPKGGFMHLLKLLKKGGRISVWVYAKEGNFAVRKFIDPVRLHLTSKMPLPLLYVLAYPPSLALFIIARYIVRPLNRFSATKRMAKFIPLNDYLYSISAFNFYSVFNIVFDQLVASKTSYITKDEIEGWFNRPDLADVVISHRNNNGWRATAVKAA